MRLLAHTMCWDYELLKFKLRNTARKRSFKNLKVGQVPKAMKLVLLVHVAVDVGEAEW